MYANLPLEMMHAPVLGPAHPFQRDGIAAGMKNHRSGHVEVRRGSLLANYAAGSYNVLLVRRGVHLRCGLSLQTTVGAEAFACDEKGAARLFQVSWVAGSGMERSIAWSWSRIGEVHRDMWHAGVMCCN